MSCDLKVGGIRFSKIPVHDSYLFTNSEHKGRGGMDFGGRDAEDLTQGYKLMSASEQIYFWRKRNEELSENVELTVEKNKLLTQRNQELYEQVAELTRANAELLDQVTKKKVEDCSAATRNPFNSANAILRNLQHSIDMGDESRLTREACALITDLEKENQDLSTKVFVLEETGFTNLLGQTLQGILANPGTEINRVDENVDLAMVYADKAFDSVTNMMYEEEGKEAR